VISLPPTESELDKIRANTKELRARSSIKDLPPISNEFPIGIVIGVIAGVLVIGGGVFLYKRKH
jgi:uncharacterized membrane protein YfcA